MTTTSHTRGGPVISRRSPHTVSRSGRASPSPPGAQTGNVSVLTAGLTAVLLLVLVALLAVGAAALSASRVRSAADLAALAGAQQHRWTGDPAAACAQARRIASANGARLNDCHVGTGIVHVTVVRDVNPVAALWGTRHVQASSRAGPRPVPDVAPAGGPG